MIKRKLSKYLMLIGAMLLVLAIVVPSVAAYEGNLIDVRAHLKGKPECNATRTPGFWQTHVDASDYVLTMYLGSSIDMGWPGEITNIGDLMGIFWADVAKESDGDHRDVVDPSGLCKSREKAAWQTLAAILNDACPNGATLPMSMEDIRAIMSGTDKGAIDDLHDLMADFNSNVYTHGLPLGIPEGNATPPGGNPPAWVNVAFADCQ